MKFHSVLVTGANRGIGLEFVKQLVSSQDAPEYVFATYRNPDARKELEVIRGDPATKSSLHLIKLDVTKKSDIEGAKKTIEDLVGEKGLTLLINNAAFLEPQPFPDLTEDNLNVHFSINTIGPIMVFQVMLPLLQKAAIFSTEQGMSFSKAAVLNITSGGGSIASTGRFGAIDISVAGYKISKAALNMAMRISAQKVREHGVLVVNMCPGVVKTDMMRQSLDSQDRNFEELLQMEEMKKVMETMEVQEPEVSVSRILKAVEVMNEANHGTFVNNFGEAFPY